MTSKACVDSARARNSGPLTPSGIRLARVLGQLKSVSDPRTSPVYAAPASAEGDEMPSENHQNLHTRSAFEAILAPHMGELHGAAMRLSRSPSDADDVLQEAMARAWMRRELRKDDAFEDDASDDPDAPEASQGD